MGASGATSRKRNTTRNAMLLVDDSISHQQTPGMKRTNTPEDLMALASPPSSPSLNLSLPTEELTSGSSEDEVSSIDDVSDSQAKPALSVRRSSSRRPIEKQLSLVKEVDVAKYMTNRQMTAKQERWNAYTMIPSPLFCLYYIFTAQWVPPLESLETYDMQQEPSVAACLTPSAFHYMPSLPPIPVVMIGAAICLHAPFSFIYHFFYAHTLVHPVERTNHLSRRLDQAMIHVSSALMSFSTSGSWQFFFINCLYNCECVYRHLFVRRVKPRANQLRILISMLAYTMPIWKRGEQPVVFLQVWACFALGGWFFIAYPIGGWSHSVFHLIVALAIPLLMTFSVTQPASQAALQQAVWCSGLTASA
ncbi:hypothetical protein MPSEU_000450300 [Mayamaea pseudoterrestris]|nr:hypothetical protein MPSEU_000450300 [Mayamaea pseudoterrestris]